MDILEVKSQIINEELRNFYIFYGDELEVMNRYVNKIAEVSNKKLKRVDTIGECLKSRGSSLFSQSFCYVCRDDMEFIKSEKAWDSIEKLLGNNTLILLVSKVDKRGKFYKHFEDRLVLFDYLDKRLLIKYIQSEIQLSDVNCEKLIDICRNDYSRILMEMDKIKCYHRVAYTDRQMLPPIDKAFLELLNNGTIYIPPEDAIFKWVDAMLSGKPRKAFTLLEECNKIGEPALRLLLVLYTNTKHLLQVQSCESKDIEKSTGLTYWEIKGVRDKCGIYSNRELVDALYYIRETEKGIKTGQIEESMAVPYVMVNMLL